MHGCTSSCNCDEGYGQLQLLGMVRSLLELGLCVGVSSVATDGRLCRVSNAEHASMLGTGVWFGDMHLHRVMWVVKV